MKQLFSNYRYLFQDIRSQDITLIAFYLFGAILSVALPLTSVFLSSSVVRMVTDGFDSQSIILYTAALCAGVCILSVLKKFTDERCQTKVFSLGSKYQLKYLEKYMITDYENIESVQGIERAQLASSGCSGWGAGVRAMLDGTVQLLSGILGFLSYGTVISMLHPVIVILLLAVTLGNFFLVRFLTQRDYEDKKDYSKLDRRIDYLIAKCKDFTYAKEIRLFSMKDFLLDKFHLLLGQRLQVNRRGVARNFGVQVCSAFLNLLQAAVMYGYLLYRFIGQDLTVAQFVLYLGTITGFSGWIVQVIYQVGTISRNSMNITDMRCFFEQEDSCDKPAPASIPKDAPEIRIEHLSFGYSPDKMILNDLSLTIGRGEKIALVGLNGAGKTTLVKLLCGLYTPQSGTISFDGIPMNELCIKDLFSAFSVVFQDIYLLPVSIAENVALTDQIDRDKLREVMALSGLDEVVAKLPQKEQTLLVKELHENAVELSGGEVQKLALARALYKNGSIMVLDEPTAALDPISEDAIYQKYNEMTAQKTSVFISHRLASTRFCDKIYLLENGMIAEAGTHDELMQLGGKYAELFAIQSKYYQKEVSNSL